MDQQEHQRVRRTNKIARAAVAAKREKREKSISIYLDTRRRALLRRRPRWKRNEVCIRQGRLAGKLN